MSGRSYRELFRSQKNKECESDDSRRKDASSEADCAVSQLSASKLMEPRDKEGDKCLRELASDTEEECLKRFEDGAGRLVSDSRSSVAIISRDVGEAQLSNSRSRGSIEKGSDEPPDMKPSVTTNVVRVTLTDDPCFGAEVSPELEIVESDSIGVSMTRNRKRVQNIDGPSKKQEMESDSVKKHRKVIANGVNSSLDKEPAGGHGIRCENQSLAVPAMGGGISSPSSASSLNSHDNVYLPEGNQDQSLERLISNEQKSIHTYLTAEMEKLCEILALEVNMKHVLHLFLGYVVENFRVGRENVAIFQALQISLCWIAASILKQKIDRQDYLMLAKKKLNFECSDEEAECIYKKLRTKKKAFLQQPNIIKKLQALINPTSTEEHLLKDMLDAKTLEPIHSRSESQEIALEENLTDLAHAHGDQSFNRHIRSESQEIAHEENITDLAHAQGDQSCNHESRTKATLCEKQQEEIDEFHKLWEVKRLLLEKKKYMRAVVIRQLHSEIVVRTEKLKSLDTEFSLKFEKHNNSMEADLQDLKAKHRAAIIEEREKASQRLAKYRRTENKSSDEVPVCSFPATGLATFNEEERTSILRDEEHHEVAFPSHSPQSSHSEKHPKSDRENHEKQPSASNILHYHHVLKGIDANGTGPSSDQESLVAHPHEVIDSVDVEEEVPDNVEEEVPDNVQEEVRIIDDPDANNIVLQSTRAEEDEDRLVGSDTPNLLVNQMDDANGTDPSLDQASLVAHSHEVIDSVDVQEEVRSIDDPDTNNIVIQSIKAEEDDDRLVGSDTPDLLVNQRDDANGTDPSLDQVSLVAHSHEVIDSVDHAISTPLQQATTNELTQCAVSTEVQFDDQPIEDNISHFGESVESENVVQLVTTHDLTAEAGGASFEVADKERTTETNYSTCLEKQASSVEHLPLGSEFGGYACQSLNDGCPPFQATETHHQVEDSPNHSHHQSQVRENVGPSSSSDIRNPNIENNRHNQPPVDNQGGDPTSGLFASLHRVAQPGVVDDGLDHRINGAVLQAANRLGLSNSHTSSQGDPLQIEFGKLRKEIEQVTKGHENLKSQLRSDCEKEIMEVLSEIRNKYEAKIQDAESMFQLKKKALDSNLKKVVLNKILAGFMHQLQQMPLQPTPGPSNVGLSPAAQQYIPLSSRQRPSNVGSSLAGSTPAAQQNTTLPPTRCPSTVGSSSAGSTPTALQNTSLTLPGEPRLAALAAGASCRPPIINSISCPQTNARVGADFRATAPHLQSVAADVRAAAPHLRPIGADIRAAAPHLHPFRPPVFVPDPSHSSLPHSLPTQQLSRNQPSQTLPSQVQHVQQRELLSQKSSPMQPSEPSPRIPLTATQLRLPPSQTSGSHVSPSESQRVGPASYHFRHLPALDLLRDMDRRVNAVLPNPTVSPVIPNSSVGPLSQASSSAVQGGLTSTSVETDVVYLSDDE